jgi:hypothetical protein
MTDNTNTIAQLKAAIETKRIELMKLERQLRAAERLQPKPPVQFEDELDLSDWTF